MSRNSAVSAISSSFAERVFTLRRSALTSFLSSLDGRPAVSFCPAASIACSPFFSHL